MSESSAEQEKETYSVDEMMSRLREGERSENGERESELVTREDGSQAIKVRKRKRRTKQEKVEKAKRAKRWGIVKVVSLITVPLVLGLALLILLARYHSPGYLRDVTASVGKATGANVRIQRLSTLITQVKSPTVLMAWPDGSLLDQLKVTDVSGDLDIFSAFGGKLSGADLNATSGFMIFSRREDRKVNPPREGGGALPEFDRFSSSNFALYFGGMKSAFRLEDTRASFSMKDGIKFVSLNGGDLNVAGWGNLPLQRGSLELGGNVVEVSSLRFVSPGQSVSITGDLSLDEPEHRLDVEMKKGTFETFGGENLGRLFEGPLDETTGELTFDSWDVRSHEVALSALPLYLEIKNFQFLDSLERVYGDPAFQKFEFKPTTPFELVRGPGFVEIRNFEAISIGVLGLRGNLRVEGDMLTGEMEVGIPDHRPLKIGQGNRDDFFSQGKFGEEESDGFYWFDIELSGTTDKPEDNFWDYFQSEREKVSDEQLFEDLTQ